MSEIKDYIQEEIKHFKKCGCQLCETRIETLKDVMKHIEEGEGEK